ncbi:hypothetical protein PIB30_077465 [Stylosanthes scabra]|uniref:Uncharacterized protein n=1 Tax=Stylosanthes scabra TaxID=79078 RepID=A0ABU6VRS5_9FABA|nr:hypothetical protein [Stylosanthes scabra]
MGFIRGFEILLEYLGQEPLLEVFFSFFQAKGVRKGGLVTLSGYQRRSLFSLYKSSYKDFKRMFIKVRSPETKFPFYIDGCLLKRFPLYWYSEPVQVLGMEEVNEKSALVIDFLDIRTGGLKKLFKLRNEKELSASNVVKAERGMEVNQPSKRRKNTSVKRMRAEETSGKEKLIDLTSSKCCEYFQSKANFALIEDVGDVARGQFMQVMAARLWCIGRYEELKGKKEMEHKK